MCFKMCFADGVHQTIQLHYVQGVVLPRVDVVVWCVVVDVVVPVAGLHHVV